MGRTQIPPLYNTDPGDEQNKKGRFKKRTMGDCPSRFHPQLD